MFEVLRQLFAMPGLEARRVSWRQAGPHGKEGHSAPASSFFSQADQLVTESSHRADASPGLWGISHRHHRLAAALRPPCPHAFALHAQAELELKGSWLPGTGAASV